MCGIIAVYNHDLNGRTVIKKIRKQYKKQMMRGSEAFGIAIYNGDNRLFRRRALDVDAVLNKRVGDLITKGSFVLFHHRLATSTINNNMLTHPFFNESGDVALIHNGVIGDYLKLYNELKAKGHVFETEHKSIQKVKLSRFKKIVASTKTHNINDSEVLLHLYEDGGEEKVLNTGVSIAVGIIDARHKKMVMGRCYNPLNYDVDGRGNILIASELKGKTLPYGAVMSININGDMDIKQILTEKIEYHAPYKGYHKRTGAYNWEAWERDADDIGSYRLKDEEDYKREWEKNLNYWGGH